MCVYVFQCQACVEAKAPPGRQDQAQVPALLQERSPVWLEVSWTTKGVHSASCSAPSRDELPLDKHPPIHSSKGLHLCLQFCDWSLLVQTGP